MREYRLPLTGSGDIKVHTEWKLQMQVDWSPLAATLLVALGAALLAGIYPAWRLGRMEAAEALRSE